jgi:hypothetical protein
MTGSCYLMTSTPTNSIATYSFTAAACYAKSARLPPTWRIVALCCG